MRIITEMQAAVLENLHRVIVTKTERKTRYSLDGRDCRAQIISLAAHGLILWDGSGRPAKPEERKIAVLPRGDRTKAGEPS